MKIIQKTIPEVVVNEKMTSVQIDLEYKTLSVFFSETDEYGKIVNNKGRRVQLGFNDYDDLKISRLTDGTLIENIPVEENCVVKEALEVKEEPVEEPIEESIVTPDEKPIIK